MSIYFLVRAARENQKASQSDAAAVNTAGFSSIRAHKRRKRERGEYKFYKK